MLATQGLSGAPGIAAGMLIYTLGIIGLVAFCVICATLAEKRAKRRELDAKHPPSFN